MVQCPRNGGCWEKLERGPEMSMKDEAGLGLAIKWVQQALISAFEDNCPLRPIRKGRKSLRWTSQLELLRREVRRLFNRCRAKRDPDSWELYREAQQRYRKEVRKASRETWRTFISSVNDLLRSARIHRALRTLKSSWAPWWLPRGCVRSPRGRPWISCLLLTSLGLSVLKEKCYPPLPAIPIVWTGRWLRRLSLIDGWSGQLILLPHTKVQVWMGYFLLFCKRDGRSLFLT